MISRTQFWLVELSDTEYPELNDGPHSNRAGAEEALALITSLKMIPTEGRNFAIGELILTEPNGNHGSINQDAVDTLNATLEENK